LYGILDRTGQDMIAKDNAIRAQGLFNAGDRDADVFKLE
jgi:hypothetical protein